jgi:circadian clock protein KaiB
MKNMEQPYNLKLFVAGANSKAQQIHKVLEEALTRVLNGHYDLELVDVLLNPDRARQFGVFATPTLIRDVPEPLRRVVGKLDDPDSVAMAVELVRQ